MVLFTATKPGGAACIFPVFKAWRAKHNTTELVVSGNAELMARKLNIDFTKVSEDHAQASKQSICAEILTKRAPCLIVAGILGSWYNGLDLAMLRQAKLSGISTLGILDSWMNLGDRFFENRYAEMFSPDVVAVPDRETRNNIIALGVSPESVVITGQPAFDEVLNWQLPPKPQIRSRYLLEPDETCLVFFSEPIHELAMPIGFDQDDALMCLVDGLVSAGVSATILFKRHPVLEGWRSEQSFGHVKIRPVDDNESIDNLMAVADIVAGISSTLLVQSYIAGIPTMLLHPGLEQGTDTCVLSRQNYLKPITRPEEVEQALHDHARLLGTTPFPHVGSAVDSIVRIIDKMLVARRQKYE